MDNEEILATIREALSIEVERETEIDYGRMYSCITVRLLLNGEVISQDHFTIDQ